MAQTAKQPAKLTAKEMRDGIQRLEKRLDEVRQFDPSSVTDQHNVSNMEKLNAAVDDALVRTFGHDSLDYDRYRRVLDNGPFSYASGVPLSEVHKTLSRSKNSCVALLEQAIQSLKEQQAEISPSDIAPLKRVLDNFVREAKESSSDIGRRVLAAAAAKGGLNGRLHLVAEKEIQPIHERIVGQMVQQTARFSARTKISLEELFALVEPKFVALNSELLQPIQIVANAVFRSPSQQNTLTSEMAAARSRLEQRIMSAQQLQELEGPPALAREMEIAQGPEVSRKVFVVHGHDELPREKVAHFLERLGFEPIILHEQASGGRTVIEKIEAHGDVGFAVVLLTPDDEGCKKGDSAQPRARQNVILELGYFLGRLKRNRVCALKVGNVEIPSDFGGVVYVPFDDSDRWKEALGKELEEAGFEIDWNKAMGKRK